MSLRLRSQLGLISALTLLVTHAGCDAEKPKRKGQSGETITAQPRETIKKYTQEIRNLKPELAKGGQVTDGKVHAQDYITLQADVYRTTVAKIGRMNVDEAIRLYEAENGEKPKTYEEFMERVIKKGQPDSIWLPMLPYYQEYGYDPDKKELVVIEYPAKKKEVEDQWDRQVGRRR